RLGRLDEVALALAAAQCGVAAVGRRGALHHPVAEVVADRVDCLRMRHRVAGKGADPVAGARAAWRSKRSDAEAAVAAAMLRARNVVAAHVLGQRDVALRISADPLGPEL